MQDLISIVVPVYKVEKYIKECLDSIINQTYTKIEVILVDDGSPDESGKICDEYAHKDVRIKVIHKKNGGLSDARNYGIDIAQGKYITFIDSDDYIDSKYIEELYNAIKLNDVKVSQCNILKVNDEKEILRKIGYLDSQIKSGKEMIKDIYNKHWIENVVVWNKMYAKELFKDLRYPVGKIHEDEYTTYKILYDLDKVAIINKYLHNYRQNENSIIGRSFNVKRLDVLEAFEERLMFFKERNEIELYELTLIEYLQKIRECYIKTKKYINKSQNIQLDLINKYRKNLKIINTMKDIDNKKKIKLFLFYIFPKLYYKIKEIKY